jgi:hypothetical protein
VRNPKYIGCRRDTPNPKRKKNTKTLLFDEMN